MYIFRLPRYVNKYLGMTYIMYFCTFTVNEQEPGRPKRKFWVHLCF